MCDPVRAMSLRQKTLYIKQKGIDTMTPEIKLLKIRNRIALLESRPKDNGRIVKKLKRQYKQQTGKEYNS